MVLSLPKLTKIEVDSIDVTNYVSSWKINREFGSAITGGILVLKKTVENLGISFDDINVYHTVEIWRGKTTSTDVKIFKGEVETFKKDNANVICVIQDELSKAVRSEVTKSFDKNIDTEAGIISNIFITLMTDYAGLNADSSSVQNSGTVIVLDKFICNHADVFERCEKLADALDWQFYYNPTDDKVYFEPKGTPINSSTLEVSTNIIRLPQWSYDKTNMCNKITIIGGEELVETTENGQIGVTNGYTTTSVNLSHLPFSVKVYSDSGNPPTTLREGGNESTSGVYHYSVDIENKKIVWNTSDYTPGASDYVSVEYSYKIPKPVLAKNAKSISIYGTYAKSFFRNELKEVSDIEEYVKTYVSKYATPFLYSTLAVINVEDLYPGETIQVIDSLRSINKNLLINKVTMVYPYKFDQVIVGDKKLRTASWGANTMDRIRRLEEKQTQADEILTQIFDFDKEIKTKRRYMELQKKTYPAGSSDVMIWGSTPYGIWGTNKWGDTVSAFLLGSPLYAVLGVNKLGDSTGASYVTQRITQGKNTYKEYLYDDTFKDSSNTTANWNTGTKEITFTSGQIAQTSAFFYDLDSGNVITKATATVTVSTGSVSLQMTADGTNWESVTSGTEHTFANTGSDLRLRITEDATSTATVTYIEVSYTI